MNRRAFLGTAGAVLSVGLLGRTTGSRDDELVVRVWRSEDAAEYDDLGARVRGYLHAGLDPVFDSLRVDLVDDPVALPREGGRDVLARHWTRLVIEGAGGLRRIDPVGGINLLVTDGDPTRQPAGFARPHVAATTGASYLAAMPPAEAAVTDARYSLEAAATQLLLHECGHALGLSHRHGVASTSNGRVVASPMVSSYLWADADVRRQQLTTSENVCGGSFPPADAEGERWLRVRYSACALDALRGGGE